MACSPYSTPDRGQPPRNSLLMKLLFDLFPVILFFVAFKFSGNNIFLATGVAIVATFVQIGWVWHRHRKVDTMLWISLGVITVFGGATLIFQNETFIKWKPTVLYWLFASVLLGGRVFLKRNLIKVMLEEKMKMPDLAWNRMNLSWVGFFTAMGFANLFVAYSFSTETWVNFKLFGGMGLTFLFVLLQGFMLSKYIEEKSPEEKV
jgi:intracellular septation protein